MAAFAIAAVGRGRLNRKALDRNGCAKDLGARERTLRFERTVVARRGSTCVIRAMSKAFEAESAESALPAPPPEATDARKLACMLAAQWSNKEQAIENPPFWSHIHVIYRPLPAGFFKEHQSDYAFYTESAYDYNLARPYKNSVVRITPAPDGRRLELASYKIEKEPEEFFYGAHDRELLEDLTEDRLAPLPCDCNTVYEWDPIDRLYRGFTRPGKKCRIGKGGYLWSQVTLKDGRYASWDLGKDVDTDERLWGAGAGPFDFFPVVSYAHEVPQLT